MFSMGDKEELGEGAEIIYESVLDMNYKSDFIPLIYKDKTHRYLLFINYNKPTWDIKAQDIWEHGTD